MQDSNRTYPDPRTIETARENIQTTREITGHVTEASKSLYMLHIEAAQQVLAENTEQMKALLQNMANLSNFLTEWSSKYQARMQRHAELMRNSFEIASRTMTEINRLMGNVISTTAAESGIDEPKGHITERRKTSQVINFADRRQAHRERDSRNAEKRRNAA